MLHSRTELQCFTLQMLRPLTPFMFVIPPSSTNDGILIMGISSRLDYRASTLRVGLILPIVIAELCSRPFHGWCDHIRQFMQLHSEHCCYFVHDASSSCHLSTRRSNFRFFVSCSLPRPCSRPRRPVTTSCSSRGRINGLDTDGH